MSRRKDKLASNSCPKCSGLILMEMACRVQPSVDDGVAFAELLQNVRLRYGIEIDADRTERAQSLDIATLQADENGRALPGRLSFVPALPIIGLASRTRSAGSGRRTSIANQRAGDYAEHGLTTVVCGCRENYRAPRSSVRGPSRQSQHPGFAVGRHTCPRTLTMT